MSLSIGVSNSFIEVLFELKILFILFISLLLFAHAISHDNENYHCKDKLCINENKHGSYRCKDVDGARVHIFISFIGDKLVITERIAESSIAKVNDEIPEAGRINIMIQGKKALLYRELIRILSLIRIKLPVEY